MRELWELFWTFAKMSAITFGGGAAMLPLLQRELVEKRQWVTEEELMERLREYGKRFKNHISEKEWDKAKNIYNIALEVSVFMQISKEHMDELFGFPFKNKTFEKRN